MSSAPRNRLTWPGAPRSTRAMGANHIGRRLRAAAGVCITGVVALVLCGCGVSVPTDPSGTLTDATGGTIRVGYSPEPGLIESAPVGAEAPPSAHENPIGPLAELVIGFATSIHADIEWSVHGEEEIVTLLEADALDLGVGAFTDQTPWADRVGVTRGYPDAPRAEGRAIVFVVQLGENAFLSALERHLDDEVSS